MGRISISTLPSPLIVPSTMKEVADLSLPTPVPYVIMSPMSGNGNLGPLSARDRARRLARDLHATIKQGSLVEQAR